MEPITFTYTPIKDDYTVPLRSHWMRSLVTMISLLVLGSITLFMLGISLLGCIMMLLTCMLSDDSGLVGILTVVFSLIGSAFTWIIPGMYLWLLISAARQFEKDERFRADITWTLDDEHVRIATRFQDVNLPWSSFRQAQEFKDYYLLIVRTTGTALRPVPKRVFTSPEQEQAFRELVERKVGTIK
ncbi:MAG: YcxB family protein [Anaerolineae bacterium]|nr:YcxB family protein [Anaerolineae bacterium]